MCISIPEGAGNHPYFFDFQLSYRLPILLQSSFLSVNNSVQNNHLTRLQDKLKLN